MNKRATQSLKPGLFMLGGIGLGAGLMFILDPDRGKTRRAQARGQAGTLLHRAEAILETRTGGLGSRAQRLVTAATSVFRPPVVTDEELVVRLHSELSRVLSNAGSIQVSVAHGRVTFSGPILAQDVRPLIESAARLPGVKHIDNHLTIYQNPDEIPGIKGHPLQAAAR